MSKSGAQHIVDRETMPSESETRFERELAELKATLARLEASLPSPPPAAQPQPRKPGKPRRHKSTAVQTSPIVAPPTPAPVPSAEETPRVPMQPAPPAVTTPLPTGTDLADPKNFGLMPPTTDLERGTTSVEEYRQRLARHLAFATKVLHTSKVPAAVWREWRAFGKAVHERLRELASRALELLQDRTSAGM